MKLTNESKCLPSPQPLSVGNNPNPKMLRPQPCFLFQTEA